MEHEHLVTYDFESQPSMMTEWAVTHTVEQRNLHDGEQLVDVYVVATRTKINNIYEGVWPEWTRTTYEVPVTSQYVWQERSAIVGQNLVPLVLTLRKWGIEHRIDQTGGFCMCLVVHTADGGVLVAGGDDDTFGYYPTDPETGGNGYENDEQPYDEDANEWHRSSRPESRAADFIVALYDRHGGPRGGTTR